MITDKQKCAINFCEDMLDAEFTGDINNYSEVSAFLDKYLTKAKREFWLSNAETEYRLERNNFD